MLEVQWRWNEFESGRDPEKFVCRASPLFFGSTDFGERFRDDRHRFASFLFAVLLLTVPPVSSHLQKWGHELPVPHGVGATMDGRNCHDTSASMLEVYLV